MIIYGSFCFLSEMWKKQKLSKFVQRQKQTLTDIKHVLNNVPLNLYIKESLNKMLNGILL